jgi:hypothetical protein
VLAARESEVLGLMAEGRSKLRHDVLLRTLADHERHLPGDAHRPGTSPDARDGEVPLITAPAKVISPVVAR